ALLLHAASQVACRGLLFQIEDSDLYLIGKYNSFSNCGVESENQKESFSVEADGLSRSVLGRARALGQPVISDWLEYSKENDVNRWILSQLGSTVPPLSNAFVI